MSYRCNHCLKRFNHIQEYEAHLSGCEFFFNSKKMKSEEFKSVSCIKLVKNPRTVQELKSTVEYLFETVNKNMVRHEYELSNILKIVAKSNAEIVNLTKKNISMEAQILNLEKENTLIKKNVSLLKTNSGVKCKKAISNHLNELKTIPRMKYKEWVESILIDDFQLRTSYTQGMTEGILTSLISHIKKDIISDIPICAFIQKPSNIYIFSQDTWLIATTVDIKFMVTIISKKIFDKYNLWQAPIIKTPMTEKQMTDDLMYSNIIYNRGDSSEKFQSSVRKKFIEKFSQDITNIKLNT